ncbi:DUF2905 domain-containing protein [Ramlibacter solisilvae]|uniref:DUF2905 domain-containing protein n=1 Tax=Ramlibacter tataouinensis TaxID=94132 RepID=A0A127JRC8_9BURK|nr:DUF2905 domain-containing protein [Ramlibacter tataouinensis]AMO22526.1 hypothetical protein UC35_06035 [Ramlibacter tataouinensis]
MQRFLVALGALLIAVGLAWPWLGKLPWGRLPGDISIEREGFSFHFPLMTSLLVSLVLSLLLWWFWRK